MDTVVFSIVALGMLALKGLVTFAIVYAGARLAIRHEREIAHDSPPEHRAT